MNRITESTVNGILDRRLLNEAGAGGGELDTAVSVQPRVNTYPGFTEDGGKSIQGGIAGMSPDPGVVNAFRPPVLTRIDSNRMNAEFWRMFDEFNRRRYAQG